MAAILQTTSRIRFIESEKFYILTKILVKFAPEDPIDNESKLVWIMADLPEPMMTEFYDAIWRFIRPCWWCDAGSCRHIEDKVRSCVLEVFKGHDVILRMW